MGKIGKSTQPGMLTKEKPKPPKLFNILFLNDDFTPMKFVVDVLEIIFHQNPEDALAIMFETHHAGKSRVGPYSHEVAEQRLLHAKAMVAESGYPLTLDIEEA